MTYDKLISLAFIGASQAANAAEAVADQFQADTTMADLTAEDAQAWRSVVDFLRDGHHRAAGATVLDMDTACRDYMDAADLGGPREALAEISGCEILRPTQADLVSEVQAAWAAGEAK